MHRGRIQIHTTGRGLFNITEQVEKEVKLAAEDAGICHIFVHHTSASLIIQENADRDVERDLNAFFQRLVPDGDLLYRHIAEGPDDMSAHVRSVLTATSLSVPVQDGVLDLGTWQGIFLWEHRTHAHTRRMTITVY